MTYSQIWPKACFCIAGELNCLHFQWLCKHLPNILHCPLGSQSLMYLLSGPSQRMFVDPDKLYASFQTSRVSGTMPATQ